MKAKKPGGGKMEGKMKVKVGYKRKGRKARIQVVLQEWNCGMVKELLGVNRELAEAVWGSYEEFKKKYRWLYSTGDDYVNTYYPAEDGLFNLDILADVSTSYLLYTLDLVETGLTENDLKEAIDEFLDAVDEVYSKLKSLEKSSFEKEKEFERIDEGIEDF